MHHQHRFERPIEIYENERMWIGRGFSQAGLLPTDRVGPYSTRDGSLSWKTLDEAIEALLLRRQSNNNNNDDDDDDDVKSNQIQQRHQRGRGWSFHEADDLDLNDDDDDDFSRYHKTTTNHCKEATSNTAEEDYYFGFDGSKSSTKRIIFTKDYLYHGFAPFIVSLERDPVTTSSNSTMEEDDSTPSLSITDEDGWQYYPDFSPRSLSSTCPHPKRGMLDFVRRRKLTRTAVFRPDHFLPEEVYAKCDFCDSNVVNMLSDAILDALALAALFTHGSTDTISDAQALELKCKLMDTLSIGENCGCCEPYPDEGGVGVGVGRDIYNYDPWIDINKLKDRMCLFAETCVGKKEQHGLLVLHPDNDIHQNIVTIMPTMRRAMSRYLGERERQNLARLLVKDIDRHSHKLHCSTDYCSQYSIVAIDGVASRDSDNLCRFRLGPCSNAGCDATFSFLHQIQHDEEECQYKILACPNGCGVELRRKDVPTHVRDVCSLRHVTCPLCEFGCNDVVQARDINNHLNESIEKHFALVVNRMLEYQTEMKDMKDYIRSLEETNSLLKNTVEKMSSEMMSVTKRLGLLEGDGRRRRK